MRHWLFSCKKVSALISESMDHKLPIYKRLGIQFHLMMCALCRRYRKQLLLLRSVFREREDEQEETHCDVLPADARQRIEKVIVRKAGLSSSTEKSKS
ncbi:MAG: zf-HC2 domain-containing protein [Desulfocapsa sp.]|nr:MAG: zf-HC2 domain-containing protein [Desulfocapsa sp.]